MRFCVVLNKLFLPITNVNCYTTFPSITNDGGTCLINHCNSQGIAETEATQ